MKYTITGFLKDQFTRVPPPLNADLTGKTILVTGSNTGIGFELAKHFAQMKPKRLILACRSQTKGLEAVAKIEKETNFKAELLPVDQSDFSSVVEFTQAFGDGPLDIAVLNAGVATRTTEHTKDGWETTLQVNHLSTALLAILLTPNLMRAAEENGSTPRLVLTASSMHYWTAFSGPEFTERGILTTLNSPNSFTLESIQASKYQDTKLLNVLFVRALAEHRSSTTRIVPTSVCPGFCYSELRREVSGARYLLMRAGEAIIARTAEQGSRQLLWAALGPDGKDSENVEAMKGAYVMNAEVREPSDFVLSAEGKGVQEKAWTETIDVLSQVTPRIREIVDKYYAQ